MKFRWIILLYICFICYSILILLSSLCVWHFRCLSHVLASHLQLLIYRICDVMTGKMCVCVCVCALVVESLPSPLEGGGVLCPSIIGSESSTHSKLGMSIHTVPASIFIVHSSSVFFLPNNTMSIRTIFHLARPKLTLDDNSQMICTYICRFHYLSFLFATAATVHTHTKYIKASLSFVRIFSPAL